MGDPPEWVLAVNVTSPRSMLRCWMHPPSSGTTEWNSLLAGVSRIDLPRHMDMLGNGYGTPWTARESQQGCGEVVFPLRQMIMYIKRNKVGAYGVVVMLTQELCNENEGHPG